MLFSLFLACLFVGGTIAAMLGSYALMRRLAGGQPEAHTRDLASSVIFRISALHGLILALVFAQEMVEYQQLKLEAATEASATADVYYDAARYGGPDVAGIRAAMARYARLVAEEEWAVLGARGTLIAEAWVAWDAAYADTLDLVPQGPRQESLREHMLEQLHTIARMRDKRQNHGGQGISIMFWMAAAGGVIFIALGYYTFPPNANNVLLIALFGAFTGFVLFLIHAFANPYAPPGALSPAAFERLVAELAETD